MKKILKMLILLSFIQINAQSTQICVNNNLITLSGYPAGSASSSGLNFKLATNFCGTSYSPPSGCVINWTSNGGITNNSQGTSVNFKYLQPGTYDVYVSQNLCDDSNNDDSFFASGTILIYDETLTSNGSGNGNSNVNQDVTINGTDVLDCSPESNSLGDQLSYFLNNFYTLEINNPWYLNGDYDNYQQTNNISFYDAIYSLDPFIPYNSNLDFTLIHGANPNEFFIIDPTPSSHNYSVLVCNVSFLQTSPWLYSQMDPATKTIQSCIQIEEEEDNIFEVFTELEQTAFLGGNGIEIKEIEGENGLDLYFNETVILEVEPHLLENGNKFIYDWFVRDFATNQVKLIAEDKSSVEVLNQGEYFVQAKAKKIVDISNENVIITGPSEYYVSSSNKVIVFNSSSNLPIINSFNIYPNPVNEVLNLQYELSGNVEEVRFDIYDLMENNEWNLIEKVYVEEQVSNIDLSWLNSGSYVIVLNVNNNSAIQSKMFIKE